MFDPLALAGGAPLPAVLELRRMAKRLGLKVSALRSLAERGVVPCLPAGDTFLFDPAVTEAALSELAGQSTAADALAAILPTHTTADLSS